jgi:hypothetical protein
MSPILFGGSENRDESRCRRPVKGNVSKAAYNTLKAYALTMTVIIELFSFSNTGVGARDLPGPGWGLKSSDISRATMSETESLREELELDGDGPGADGAKAMSKARSLKSTNLYSTCTRRWAHKLCLRAYTSRSQLCTPS